MGTPAPAIEKLAEGDNATTTTTTDTTTINTDNAVAGETASINTDNAAADGTVVTAEAGDMQEEIIGGDDDQADPGEGGAPAEDDGDDADDAEDDGE